MVLANHEMLVTYYLHFATLSLVMFCVVMSCHTDARSIPVTDKHPPHRVSSSQEPTELDPRQRALSTTTFDRIRRHYHHPRKDSIISREDSSKTDHFLFSAHPARHNRHHHSRYQRNVPTRRESYDTGGKQFSSLSRSLVKRTAAVGEKAGEVGERPPDHVIPSSKPPSRWSKVKFTLIEVAVLVMLLVNILLLSFLLRCCKRMQGEATAHAKNMKRHAIRFGGVNPDSDY